MRLIEGVPRGADRMRWSGAKLPDDVVTLKDGRVLSRLAR